MKVDKGFICGDCKDQFKNSIGSFLLKNKIVKGDDKIVCSDCIKAYNIRKPN